MGFLIFLVELALALLLAHFSTGAPGSPSGSGEGECRPGQLTHLVPRPCVNIWPLGDAKFRWPDLKSSCDPSSPVCDSAKAKLTVPLRSSDCKDVRLLKIMQDDHLAKIACEESEGGRAGERFLINLDSLSCHPRNMLHYRDLRPGWEAIPTEAAREQGHALVERAEKAAQRMREAIARDTRSLLELVRDTPPEALMARMKAARDELASLLDRVRARHPFTEECEPRDPKRDFPDDVVRAQRTCRLLRATEDTAARLFRALTPESLKNAVAAWASSSDPYDQTRALTTRMLVFYAFKDSVPDLPGRLELIRKSVENGKPYFWELHAGFVYGGHRLDVNSGGGYDCSDFLASLLDGRDGATGLISTWALKSIARHLDGEREMKLPRRLEALATCFSLVDLRAGQAPRPGDVVISNSDPLKDAHLTIVKRFLPDGAIETIEASGGGANTLMSKTRPLFEPLPACSENGSAADSPQGAHQRVPLRPDLYALRLKAPPPESCPLSLRAIEDN